MAAALAMPSDGMDPASARRATSLGAVPVRGRGGRIMPHHPRGGAQPRGGGPRQRRASGSSAAAARRPRSTAAPASSKPAGDWDTDTRTAGLFDISLRPNRERSDLRDSHGGGLGFRDGGYPGGIGTPERRTPPSHREASAERRPQPKRQAMGYLRNRAPIVPLRQANLHRHWLAQQRLEAEEAGPAQNVLAQSFGASSATGRSVLTGTARSRTSTINAEGIEVESSGGSDSACSPRFPQIDLADFPSMPGINSLVADEPPSAPPQLEVAHVQTSAPVAVPPEPREAGASVPEGAEPLRLVSSLQRPPAQAGTVHMKTQLSKKERLQSVSERLSVLLGPLASGQQGGSSVAPRPGSNASLWRPADPRPTGRTLLRQSSAVVLANVNQLTDMLLEHILGDTVELLDRLPSSAEPEETLERPTPVAATSSWGREPDPVADELPKEVQRQAGLQLRRLEDDLVKKYLKAAREDQVLAGLEAYPGFEPFTSDFIPELHLRPASLSLARIKKIENYRHRFAQHCLVTREAGLEVSGPGGIVPSTATWIVWPYLADSIVEDIVHAAIEEAHEAMERHVDELIMQEIGG
eukprot:TRINITY_DN74316_c0_g1_i1.p1 TRINITY_DN74316_c0_g1~~TRINITY_DN74316_c0_g1_i1.p1  ORF type:complete len:582 (-),score=84.06 TRINITY_DN74316_c0_g1_i1:204-1949(-)